MDCSGCVCDNIGRLGCFVETVVKAVVTTSLPPIVRCEDSDTHVLVNIIFNEDHSNELVGLLLGAKYVNIKLICMLLRIQQVFPHDRYIKIKLYKPDGSLQVFEDRNVSALRKKGVKKNLSVEG